MSYPEFERLIGVIAKLRDPKDGCPWDLKQTHISLLSFLIEESYEFVHAAESGDDREMNDELGDVLLQVILHAQIGSERNAFNIESISKNLTEKMVRRHPHVFGDIDVDITPEEVKANWQLIKQKEKNVQTRIDKGVLNFPALFSANKIGEKTQKFGFDWNGPDAVEKVVHEEWQELKEELDAATPNQDRISEEFGDLLFSVAQLGRHLNINSEMALKKANEKFLDRFHKMEKLIDDDGLIIEEMNQMEMDVFWRKVKEFE